MSLQLFVLASGSKANAVLLCKDNTKILIDAGLGIRLMVSALNAAGVRPNELSAVLLTHEHTDHVRGLSSLLDRTHLPVYSSIGTLGAVDRMIPARCKLTAMDHQTVEIGPFAVRAIAVPHDAAEPVGYHIEVGNHVVTIATDLGDVPDELAESLIHSTFIMLESNHDMHMLLNGSYPVILKERIRSPFGHLSNEQTAAALAECRGNGLRTVVLAHLSDENNDPALAREASAQALAGSGAALHVTTRSTMGPFLNLE
ncbi:MBL fold metallo-hydrolase [candidate division KSB1 bacterium]|nr:MAG: MBL fold metallo-hydrolase [candidate division KSB1 bacterium]